MVFGVLVRTAALSAAISVLGLTSTVLAQTPADPAAPPTGPQPTDPAAPPAAEPAPPAPAEPTAPAEPPPPVAESPMLEEPPPTPPPPPPPEDEGADSGDDRSAGPFSKGSVRLTLLVGTGSSVNDTYLILGGGLGYFLVNGLEVGFDYEAWI